VADLDLITSAMAQLRADPPAELDGEPVSVVDLALGTGELPPTDAVLITGESVKVVVRPSGTEPKLKCYLEARRPPDSSIPLAQERRRARARLARIRGEMSVALGLGPD
jgi:phosphomannomutase